jgi:N-acetylmuramoyl-L-alanine amidase
MFGARILVFVAAAILVALPCLSVPASAKPLVTGLRTGEHTEATRFVLDISDSVSYSIFTLRDPYRVVIDFPEMDWRILQGDVVETRGLIKSFRYGRYTRGVSRVVLDLTGPVRVMRVFLLPPLGTFPYRLVIDLEAVEAAAFTQATPVAVLPVPRKKPSRASGRRIIVIDPGHGGVDPGTIGVNGAFEKDITLAMGRELRDSLKATGRYDVVMTRDDDVFMRLRDRVESARRAGGDLFISLHADSIKNRKVRGASVYTLSETASDKEAAALAAKENRADVLGGVDLTEQTDEVSSILIDLAQRETMNNSARYANLLVGEMSAQTRVLRNGHRFAGFAVLKGPDIPAVLVELGYLSNRRDERLLSSKSSRAPLVEALVHATEGFFKGGGAP